MGDTEGQASEASEASGENIPEIELIIKASTVDGRRKGACLFCQVIINLYLSRSESNLRAIRENSENTFKRTIGALKSGSDNRSL